MQKKQVKCPQCKKLTEYSATNEFRPFCSERCQLLDLGDWADEKFAIPATVSADIAEDEDDHSKKSEED